ncbi:unnamed protein product [Rotaria socialis]|uniref:Uncharacterized protein n=1 Tax=Rotaria socialis TaxID=392032 RepID=A0A820CAJ8_9BILA|nr:unnamed protein product [Rotaria socialis]
MILFLLSYSFYILLLFQQSIIINACPSVCLCNGPNVDCSNRGLQTIPYGIPKNIFKLDLQLNNLSIIRKDDFKGFRQLRILNIQDNQIHTIDIDAFRELTSLQKLRLNGNKLNHFADGTFITLKQLQRLDLSSNHLRVIRRGTLQGLHDINTLHLDHNEISCIEPEVISELKRLEIITLNSNNLTTLPVLPLAQLVDLRVLRLHDNQFVCDCRLLWLAKYLKFYPFLAINSQCQDTTALNAKDITLLADDESQCNRMDNDEIEYACNVFVCPYPCTCFNGVVDCKDKDLIEIPRNIPDTTIELRLEKNRIMEIPPKVFFHLKKLRRLDLSNNIVSTIYPDSFTGLKSLNSLLLNANKIVCVRVDTFRGLEKLSLLSLYDNQLKTLANGTFSSLKNIQTLHLARNPFLCDCHIRWLNAYLREKQIETSGVRCARPRRMAKQKFGVLKDQRFRCQNRMQYLQSANNAQCEIECPTRCTCASTAVTCRGLQLREIPNDIPKFTTELYLQDNLIKRIPRNGNLQRLKNLRILDLQNNQLEEIDDDAFNGFDSMNQLFLNNNSLHRITSLTLNGLINVQILNLNANKLTCIKNDTFISMNKLETLSLNNNQIKYVTSSLFDQLRLLSELNLESNPLICNCHMEWFKQNKILIGQPECKSLIKLHDIPISNMTDGEFVCHPTEMDMCDASQSKFCPQNCTCYDHIVRCSHAQLKLIPYEEMPIDTEELYLDSNNIEEVPMELTDRLTHLLRIDLSYNKLRSIQGHLFSKLTRLETLTLSYNKIQCLDSNAFNGLKNLRMLSLHGNEISIISEGTFKDLAILSHIALGGNPFYCDCHLAWLSSWIKADFVEPGIARCAAPPPMTNKLLLTSPISFFQCYNKSESNSYQEKCNSCLNNTNPCSNNGTCRLLPTGKYVCDCLPSFHGEHCEKLVDTCFDNPCRQQGTCHVLLNGRYQCNCLAGFTGRQCEINTNNCFSNNCQNNGTCIDNINDYSCLCLPLYTGKYCEKQLDWCDKDLNICKNQGSCLRTEKGYYCKCPLGFEGINCTDNIDDCSNHTCQFGVCIDKINGYTCKCHSGFMGKFCEITSQLKSSLLQNNQTEILSKTCTSEICSNNGICYEDSLNRVQCRCSPGFIGDRCLTLKSVHANRNNSYMKLSKPTIFPHLNITMMFSTIQNNGVLVYFGHMGHIAAELFMGRIRVSYDIGNSPGSVLFSYDTVNNGKIHELQLISIGQNFSLIVDRSYTRFINNRGISTYMNTSEIDGLYISGLPKELTTRAVQLWHIREATSFKGCIHALYINDESINFANVDYRHKILPGCVENGLNELSCTATTCQHGRCELDGFTYICKCFDGFTGPTCSEVSTSPAVILPLINSCDWSIETGYYIDPLTKCRSTRRLRMTKCFGTCPSLSTNGTLSSCCKPIEGKRRYFRMTCASGFAYRQSLEFFKECTCTNSLISGMNVSCLNGGDHDQVPSLSRNHTFHLNGTFPTSINGSDLLTYHDNKIP